MSKTLKHYERLFAFAKGVDALEKSTTTTFFKQTTDYSFDTAEDIYTYLISTYEKFITTDDMKSEVLCKDILEIFNASNKTRTQKMLLENTTVQRALYLLDKNAVSGLQFEFLITLVQTSKTEAAETLLKHLQRNSALQFGQTMKTLIEQLFIAILAKQGNTTKKVELNKKQVEILTAFVKQIKGPERPLLEQRINELRR
ncbi:MAG: hypothetical protein FWB72_03805 [Firmicutes bacterium]|nr:hypothetical protein [Bacillota bacterium]